VAHLSFFRPLSPTIVKFLLEISAEIFDKMMCPVYLGHYFSAVSHSQFIFHENICYILVTAFKYLKIQEVDEGEWYGPVTSFKLETNTVILLLFVKMFQMPYMSLQQADTFTMKISIFWVFFKINFSVCGVYVRARVCTH